MFFVILATLIVLLGLFAAFAVRYFRSPPETRRALLGFNANRRAFWGITAVIVIGSAVIFSFFGIIGIRATSAARDYLHEQFGPSDTWEISLGAHSESSKKPQAGFYEMSYSYGEKKGRLRVEYLEQDGKLNFHVTPK